MKLKKIIFSIGIGIFFFSVISNANAEKIGYRPNGTTSAVYDSNIIRSQWAQYVENYKHEGESTQYGKIKKIALNVRSLKLNSNQMYFVVNQNGEAGQILTKRIRYITSQSNKEITVNTTSGITYNPNNFVVQGKPIYNTETVVVYTPQYRRCCGYYHTPVSANSRWNDICDTFTRDSGRTSTTRNKFVGTESIAAIYQIG